MSRTDQTQATPATAEGASMSSEVCVCGQKRSKHGHSMEEVHVDCTADGLCYGFRAVLDWPDSEGWWWFVARDMKHPRVCEAHQFKGHEGFEIWAVAEWKTKADFTRGYGPARFTKCEPNPFQERA